MSEPAPTLEFNPLERGQRLAMLLQGIEECEQEMADYRASHKARMETLRGQLWKLRHEILSGQMAIPLEPIPAPEPPILTVMEKVVEQVNSGALNTGDVKCTAEIIR